MEIESENGTKTTLEKGQNKEIGRRELGSNSKNDKKVSRKQISFSLQQNPKTIIQFKVIGKNPIWVYEKCRDEIRVFKRGEKGEILSGDMFCICGEKPFWFSVREKVKEIGCVVDLDSELASFDVSALDPVKDFGFLVIGHEFDNYPKHKISPPQKWDWFLEEPKKGSDDDNDDETDGRKRNKSTRRKRKKGDENDDDEWTGESEEDKELISKTRKVQRPKYSTRSKEHPAKDKGKEKSSTQTKIISTDEEDEEDEDEEDDTLGGFIVKDNEVKEEEEDNDDETELDEEEDEFEEDDED